jgi:hypothetical protein
MKIKTFSRISIPGLKFLAVLLFDAPITVAQTQHLQGG